MIIKTPVQLTKIGKFTFIEVGIEPKDYTPGCWCGNEGARFELIHIEGCNQLYGPLDPAVKSSTTLVVRSLDLKKRTITLEEK